MKIISISSNVEKAGHTWGLEEHLWWCTSVSEDRPTRILSQICVSRKPQVGILVDRNFDNRKDSSGGYHWALLANSTILSDRALALKQVFRRMMTIVAGGQEGYKYLCPLLLPMVVALTVDRAMSLVTSQYERTQHSHQHRRHNVLLLLKPLRLWNKEWYMRAEQVFVQYDRKDSSIEIYGCQQLNEQGGKIRGKNANCSFDARSGSTNCGQYEKISIQKWILYFVHRFSSNTGMQRALMVLYPNLIKLETGKYRIWLSLAYDCEVFLDDILQPKSYIETNDDRNLFII